MTVQRFRIGPFTRWSVNPWLNRFGDGPIIQLFGRDDLRDEPDDPSIFLYFTLNNDGCFEGLLF